ncbi:hypothetical protein BDV29DRAFT_184348 [Aspergillus leporis]|uniref:Uncharacterized protein n=1 Tax=Aspergillus leporis TaxID=41062 RepID=A0A5N5WJR8_9EURO|nr:hypothetical protein BDV29DRAFT_184348 [Aspergillus leporis]
MPFLKKDTLVQVSVSCEFGLVDMYRYRGFRSPRHIEDSLGKLESHATNGSEHHNV